MSLYYLTPYQRKMLRERMLDRSLDAKLAGEACQVIIPVDVIAYDEGYTINAFIPGVSHEDINIEVVEDTVTIDRITSYNVCYTKLLRLGTVKNKSVRIN